jgi:type IV pilus assembly protein PilW
LLVALAATTAIAAATLTIAISSRGMLETDQHRTTVNQNLRAGMDLVGIEVRQAGERLPWDGPAVDIIDGASGAPDELVLRRNLLDYVLPVCKNIGAGTAADAVFIARKKLNPSDKVPPGCYPVPDDNGDGWPDNLEQWRDYRIAQGGVIEAYIHNPITGNGEYFVYDAEDAATFHLHKDNSETWTYDYPVKQNPRVYIIEAKRFRLDGDILQSVVDNDTAKALNLVNHIEDFQVRAFMNDGSVQDFLSAGQCWTDLQSLEVTLRGQSDLRKREIERTVVTHFFPRNILSN